MEKVSDLRLRVHLESRRYLGDIGAIDNMSIRHTVPVSAYVLCSHMCMPVKTVIVAERPYATAIHPQISSAMSYDPSLSGPTPSTIGVARDLMNSLGVPYASTEKWFRDSWKHLRSGCIVVNCCVYKPFTSSGSLSETVPFQRWLRVLLESSMLMSNGSVDVICMGVPSFNVVDSMLSSMGKLRSRVRKRRYPNPAVWNKPGRDSLSLDGTFNERASSIAIAKAIDRSSSCTPLRTQDFASCLSNMSSQIPQVESLLTATDQIVSEIEKAYNAIKKDHPPPSLMSAKDEFCRALVEYRDSVLKDIVADAVAKRSHLSPKAGKSTEWGSKSQWVKAPSSVGTSTKMSAVPESTEGMAQVFADDEPPPADKVPDDSRDADTPPAKPKKTKIVKRLVRRPASGPQERISPLKDCIAGKVGDSVNEDQMRVLEACKRYLHIHGVGGELTVDGSITLDSVVESMESRKIASDHVVMLLVAAEKDRNGFPDLEIPVTDTDGTLNSYSILVKTMDNILAY